MPSTATVAVVQYSVPDCPNSYNCSVKLGNTYQCPAGQNGNLFLTGFQNFAVNEIEVFVFEN